MSDGPLLRLDPRRVWIDADETEALSADALNGTPAGAGESHCSAARRARSSA
ncbi:MULTISPECIES: hypothetical protein [unclassified Streptomyces]|uniref:hypothetical protein n=1 Tax=unclassified Streptomyces TaxID=2593676 RepID=UPI0035D70FFE